MGQKPSQPSKKLEYTEHFVYMHKQSFRLHNIVENKIEATHKIQDYSSTIFDTLEHVGKYWCWIYSIGIGEIMFAYTLKNKEFWLYVVFIHKDWKTNQSEWLDPNIHIIPCTIANANELIAKKVKEIKRDWVTGSQRKQLDQQFQKQKFEMTFLSPEKCDMTIDGTFLSLKQIIKHHDILSVTYCKYDEIIISCTKMDVNFILHTWSKKNAWQMTKCKALHELTPKGVIDTIYSLECSRKYLLIGARMRTHTYSIIVLDKDYNAIYQIPGYRPTCRNDYHMWLKENVELLKTVEEMKKMAEAILGIILSYVD